MDWVVIPRIASEVADASARASAIVGLVQFEPLMYTALPSPIVEPVLLYATTWISCPVWSFVIQS